MALTSAEVDLCNQSLGKIGGSQFTFGDITSEQSVQCLLHFEQTRNALLRSFTWPFAKIRLSLVRAWLTDTVYTTDQYVWQDSLLYKCIVAHTSDVFATDLTAANWTLVSTIDAWVTLKAYVVGNLVTTNALLYKCLIAHTSGTFSTDLAAGNWVLETVKPTNVFGFNYDLPALSLRLSEFIDSVVNLRRNRKNIDWRLETNTILTEATEVDIVYINTITDTTEWDDLFTELFIAVLAKKLFAPLAGAGSGSAALREALEKEIRNLKKSARTIARQEGGNTSRLSWVEARLNSNRVFTTSRR